MLKNLAITPPVLGRISIGRVVEKNGKRLPEKNDEFTITTQVQSKDGWLLHPYDEGLRKACNGKLRSIPVTVMFDDPNLSLRAEYSLFDRQTGRPVCVGNGETCRRYTANGLQSLPCPSPNGCDFANGVCKPYGRLNVRIGAEDELGSFTFRTTGFNSIRTLTARLRYFHAVSGGLLAALPLELRLRAKSTTQSHRAPIYYVDLTIRSSMSLEEAIAEAREVDARRKASGFDQAALDAVAKAGFGDGAFEDTDDEIPAIVEEFYNDSDAVGPEPANTATTLKDKLDRKAATNAGDAS
ncbi:recombination directionality factor [Ralstonia mannitolilytica]|uniref:Hydrolase or metal-binding protein n=1 Tax=Ralstonia mannitolilytica TaxID=105219 RepID=A0AAD2ENM1_9RALS|nr:hydrolase or metal-binding protein [Ralstonia mannitolilytica]MBY4721430.1 hydrolase or metal-binding protein [Ralstonia mannitolilytica]CAJ0697968.1 hypothetical protein R77591_04893 [Ralstonia mannitolilytica]